MSKMSNDEKRELVGRSRILLVDGLEAIYDDVVKSKTCCWVSLEGPSGWGKTRVVHELFKRLSKRQEEPRYWPDVIDDPDDRDSGRKAAQPRRFTRDASSLPDFLWWGIECSARGGLQTKELARDVEWLHKHDTYVEKARRRLISPGDFLREMVEQQARSIRRAVVEEGAAEAINWITGAVFPGSGLAYKIGQGSVAAGRRKRQERREIASETTFGEEDSSDPVDEVVYFLGKLTAVGFPVVIFFEDAHEADKIVLELLGKVLSRGGTVFAITTSWPDFAARNPALGELMSEYEGRLHRVGHTSSAGEPFPEGSGLCELEYGARRTILHHHYGRVEKETEKFLLERFVNPLALNLFCEVDKYRRDEKYRTPDGALCLPPKERDRVPTSIRELYRDLWRELSIETQFALAVAYILTPANIDSAVAKSEDVWMDRLLIEVIERFENLENPNVGDVVDALAKAPTANAWVRIVDDYLRAFSEEDQKAIVNEDGGGVLNDRLDDPSGQILAKLTDILLSADSDVRCTINGARSILALHAVGNITDHGMVAEAICLLMEDLESNLRELPERLRLFEIFGDLDPRPLSSITTFKLRQCGAWALAEAGKTGEAIAVCEDLLNEQVGELGVDHPSTLDTRRILAGRLAEAGRLEEAITELEKVLTKSEQVLEPGHPDTLRIRHNLAGWVGSAGRVEEAIERFRAVLEDRSRVLGADDPQTLHTRHNLAYWLGRAGGIDEAVRAYEELLVDRSRVLGVDHPSTLDTRNNLARWVGEAGRVKEAIDEFEAVLEGRRWVLGADHPHTLVTRDYRACWLGEAGRVKEAIDEFEAVLEDRRRVLGADHPHTLVTRGKLARWLGEAGRVKEAIGQFEAVLEDRRRVLGDDHPHTLLTRHNLAHWEGKAGFVEKAVTALERVWDDRVRVLGPKDPDTLFTRHVLGGWLGEAGHVEEAVRANRELLDDRSAVLGRDNPDTLDTHHNLAYWLGEAGRVDEAIDEFAALLEDRLRVLGTHHPHTLATRYNLARWLVTAGRADDMVTAYAEVMGDESSETARDQLDRLSTCQDLTGWLGEAGRAE